MRARYVYRPGHPKADRWNMVDVNDLGDWQDKPPALPVVGDSHYWNTAIPVYENGQVKQVDVGSRQKHREFLRQRGLTTADDYDKPGGEWERAAKEREQRQQGIFPDRKERREELGRILYEVEKKQNARRR